MEIRLAGARGVDESPSKMSIDRGSPDMIQEKRDSGGRHFGSGLRPCVSEEKVGVKLSQHVHHKKRCFALHASLET